MPETSNDRPTAVHVTAWIAQLLLAAAFAFAGITKLVQPLAELGAEMSWVNDVPGWLIRFIGVAEAAGAIGVVLPAATRIMPWLTPLAAAGLLTVMVLAAGLHLMRGEPILANVLLGALAAFVLWARWKKAPLEAR